MICSCTGFAVAQEVRQNGEILDVHYSVVGYIKPTCEVVNSNNSIVGYINGDEILYSDSNKAGVTTQQLN